MGFNAALTQVINTPENTSKSTLSPEEQRAPSSLKGGEVFTNDPSHTGSNHSAANTQYLGKDLCSAGKETEWCSYVNFHWRLCIENPNPGKFNSVYSTPVSKQLEENSVGHIQIHDHKLQSESLIWPGQPTSPFPG